MGRFFQALGMVLQWLLILLFFAAALGAIFGPSLWIELRGRKASGVINAKQELISNLSEAWSRRFQLEVSYLATDVEEQETAWIGVNEELFDRLQEGDTVELRYLPQPRLRQLLVNASARLEEQRTFDALVALLGDRYKVVLAFFGVWLVLMVLASVLRFGWLQAILFVALACGAIGWFSGWPWPAPEGPQETANATVRNVRLIDRFGRITRTVRNVVQPFQVVEMEFVPPNYTTPVIIVDMIDANSVPELERGSVLPISYNIAEPRWAQIEGASRNFYRTNARTFGLVALVIFVLWGWAWWQGWRSNTQERRRLRVR
jgi:hypothetical protein